MAEHLGHDRQVDAGGEQERRPAVPQVVDADLPYAGTSDELAKRLGDQLRRDRIAVLSCEDESMVCVRLAPSSPFSVLCKPLGEQDADTALPEVDAARLTALALRWCAAGMVEARQQFRRVNGHLHLPQLRAALARHVAAQTVDACSHDDDTNAA